MIVAMATRQDVAKDGRRLSAHLRRQIGEELRAARIANGLSQGTAGAAAGMSHAQFGRIERGVLLDLTIDQTCRAGLAVGLRLGARLFVDGDAVRDTAQLRLLERFRSRLPAGTEWQTEVPMVVIGDRRAWDGVARLGGRRAGCEAETRLADIQALERRLTLKLRDGDVDLLILVVADTAANRGVLATHRAALRPLLPLDGRDILAAFAKNRLPDASGLIVL